MTVAINSLYLNIPEIIDDLRLNWVGNKKEYTYNTTAFTKVRKSGQNLMFCCPFHAENNPSCGVRLDSPYSFNCFGCDSSGELGLLVSKAVGLPSELFGDSFILKNYVVSSVQDRPILNITTILDKNKHRQGRNVSEKEIKYFTKDIHPYIISRGFTERTIQKYEVGYDAATQAVTLPVRESSGKIRFIKRRYINFKGFKNEADVYKKDIVYGLYYLLNSTKCIKELYLNESETDTMSCYQMGLPAGALLGRILFKEQVWELMRGGIKFVNLFLDNDAPGRKGSLKAYYLLSKLSPIKVNAVIYPDSSKDANDLLISDRLKNIKVVPFEKILRSFKAVQGGSNIAQRIIL